MTEALLPGLTICVPAYNEVAALSPTIENVLTAARAAGREFEIIIINDGSTDGTGPAADRLAGENERVVALHQSTNLGVGAAFKRALSEAAYDRISLIPGDNAYAEIGIERLFHNARTAELVISYRENKQGRPLVRRILSTVFSAWLRVMTGLSFHDGHSLYVFPVTRARALLSKMPDDYRYHVVTLVNLLLDTPSFVQVPVPLLPRADFSSGVLRLSFLVKIGLTMTRLFISSVARGIPFRGRTGVEVPMLDNAVKP